MKPSFFRMALTALCAHVLLSSMGCGPDNAHQIVGGKGGNATIVVIPEYATGIMANATVYIKYAAVYAPSDGVYDDSMKCAVVDSIYCATFTNLSQGDYYLYARGYDSTRKPPAPVSGGTRSGTIKNGNNVVYLPSATL